MKRKAEWIATSSTTGKQIIGTLGYIANEFTMTKDKLIELLKASKCEPILHGHKFYFEELYTGADDDK